MPETIKPCKHPYMKWDHSKDRTDVWLCVDCGEEIIMYADNDGR